MHPRFLCLLFAPCLLILAGETPASDDKPAAPVKVEISQPLAREVTDHEDFTGRTAAVESATIRARVAGMLDKVFFKAGSLVKQGDVLFEIDPRPYRAELDKAEAEVVRAEARLKRAATDADRVKKLMENKSVAREDYDRALADAEEAKAAVLVARAGSTAARLNVEFTRIAAPISGRIGRPLLTAGNFVQAGTTDLATIVSADSMYVYFDVDERTALRLRQMVREGKLKEAGAPVQLGLANEDGYPRRGTIDFMDNQVNPPTSTLKLRAVFANADQVLLPGLFARVRLVTSAPYKALLIPERAINSDKGEKYVFVANDKNVAERRPVKIGSRQDGLRVVTEGITPEDRVIVNSAEAVKEGAAVEPRRVSIPAPPGPEGAR
jgi:RND family efflux transporter MFP subunit